MLGWKGKLLRIDLTNGDIRTENINNSILNENIGGAGLGTHYLYNEIKERNDPLSENNKLYIFNGPCTGTSMVCSGRFCLVTQSPLTNYFLQSHCGGQFGPELKYAGYDGLIIEGSSESPCYVTIEDDYHDIRPASHIWGKRVKSSASILENENDSESKILSIGPAGEKKILISNVMVDVYRSLGRGGAGAVFGSKNLKAIVVRGTNPLKVKDPEGIMGHILNAKEEAKTKSRAFIEYGTTNAGILVNDACALPTRNFKEGTFSAIEDISGKALKKSAWEGRRSCFSCPICCSRYSAVDGVRTEGPEYETIFALGPNVLNSDVETLVRANEKCNDIGIDTISTGVILSWLMEASENGLIDKTVEWGDGKRILEIINDVVEQNDLGSLLAQGVKRASDRIGGSEYAIHVKGLELPGYDPRGSQGMAIEYAVCNRGGCHLRAPIYVKELFLKNLPANTLEGKSSLIVDMENTMMLMDCLIICRFGSRALIEENYSGASKILEMVTGRQFNIDGLESSCERMWTMQRLFNITQGLTSKEDSLPDRFLNEGLHGNYLKKQELQEKIYEYYTIRECNKDGIPNDEKLRRLGLSA